VHDPLSAQQLRVLANSVVSLVCEVDLTKAIKVSVYPRVKAFLVQEKHLPTWWTPLPNLWVLVGLLRPLCAGSDPGPIFNPIWTPWLGLQTISPGTTYQPPLGSLMSTWLFSAWHGLAETMTILG